MTLDFEQELAEIIDQTSKTQLFPKNLSDSMRYSLLSPGKRIRPRLMIASGSLFALEPKLLAPAAVAMEMVHCFTLIHDDLPCMDDDDLRRGQPTNHKVYGENIALLAGDALIPLAVRTFLTLPHRFSRENVLLALQEFMDQVGAGGVIGGQAAEFVLTPSSSLDELLRVHARKTGALFRSSILIPRTLAGLNRGSAQNTSLERFADALGLAFQIADDLEDPPESVTPDNLTSILKHLSREDAKRTAIEHIESAARILEKEWGPKASSLVQIANEVISKVRAA